MFKPIFTIARYTFREAVRNNLFLLAILGMICFFGLTEFIGELAITESATLQAMLIAGSLRIFAVLTISLFVIVSMVREFNDKGVEFLMSLPVARHNYLFGKLLGFIILALVISVLAGILLMIYSDIGNVIVWSISLFCELGLVVSLSIFCLLTFNNITLAYILVLAFYFLSRSISAIQLISASPIIQSEGAAQEFINSLVNVIAYVLPGLHEFTRSEWLAYGARWEGLVPVIIQSIVYLGLLISASLFDLYRKEL